MLIQRRKIEWPYQRKYGGRQCPKSSKAAGITHGNDDQLRKKKRSAPRKRQQSKKKA